MARPRSARSGLKRIPQRGIEHVLNCRNFLVGLDSHTRHRSVPLLVAVSFRCAGAVLHARYPGPPTPYRLRVADDVNKNYRLPLLMLVGDGPLASTAASARSAASL